MRYSYSKFKKEAIIRYLALDKYNYIRETVFTCDVSKDDYFQKTFNSFFKVRRNKNWRKKFYNYFERIKNNPEISFDMIIKDLLLENWLS